MNETVAKILTALEQRVATCEKMSHGINDRRDEYWQARWHEATVALNLAQHECGILKIENGVSAQQ